MHQTSYCAVLVAGFATLGGCTIDTWQQPADTTAKATASAAPANGSEAPDTEIAKEDEEEQSDGTLFDTARVVEVKVELSATDWAAMQATAIEENYYTANLVFDGERVEQISIRTKGNSSLGSVVQADGKRFSFKVDLNRNVTGTKLHGKKKFVLNNGFKDPSYMQEALAFKLMRDFGVPAPQTSFVDLWVAGEHLGLYTLGEAVDGSFLKDYFADNDGDLYKPEMGTGNLTDSGDDIAAYTALEPESNEETTDHAAFLALIRAINRGEPLASVLDIDEATAYLAVSTALVNLDSYQGMGHNYYLYEQAGLFSIVAWDMNEAFGTFNCGCNIDGIINFRIDEPTCGSTAQKPLIPRLFEVAGTSDYHAKLDQLTTTLFTADALAPQIDAMAALIRPYVEADPTKFGTLAEFDARTSTDAAARANRGTLIGFIVARSAAIRAQLAGTAAAVADGEGSCQGGGAGGPGGPGGPGGGPGGSTCTQQSDCTVAGTLCHPQMQRCVPDCRQSACPTPPGAAQPLTCDTTSGFCHP